jgi:virulence factor Mce-like protein
MAIFRSRTHGEPTRRELAIQGVVVLGVILALLGILALKLDGGLSSAVPVTAEMESAGGAIRSGVDVKMRGMVVGKVTSVEGDEHQVRLGLEIDKRHVDQIPSGVLARVLPASVFGTSYVDLVLPAGVDRGDTIEADDTIKQDTSQETLELQTALDSIDTLVDALGPAELATALHTLSSVLDGRGDDLGVAFDTLDRYTTRFAPMIPRLRGDLRLLAVNLSAVARNAPELLDATEDGLVVLDNLVDRRDKITALLDGGLALIEDTQEFLTDHERAYLHALSRSVVLVDAVHDERGGLRDTLLETGDVSSQLLTVLEDGYARVEGYVYAGGPVEYTRADCPRYGSLPGGNCG